MKSYRPKRTANIVRRQRLSRGKIALTSASYSSELIAELMPTRSCRNKSAETARLGSCLESASAERPKLFDDQHLRTVNHRKSPCSSVSGRQTPTCSPT